MQTENNAIKFVLDRVERFRLDKLEQYKKGRNYFLSCCVGVLFLTVWAYSFWNALFSPCLIGGIVFLILTYDFSVRLRRHEYQEKFKELALSTFVQQRYLQIYFNQTSFVTKATIEASMLFRDPKKISISDILERIIFWEIPIIIIHLNCQKLKLGIKEGIVIKKYFKVYFLQFRRKIMPCQKYLCCLIILKKGWVGLAT